MSVEGTTSKNIKAKQIDHDGLKEKEIIKWVDRNGGTSRKSLWRRSGHDLNTLHKHFKELIKTNKMNHTNSGYGEV